MPEDGERVSEDPKAVVLVPTSKPAGAPTEMAPVRNVPEMV